MSENLHTLSLTVRELTDIYYAFQMNFGFQIGRLLCNEVLYWAEGDVVSPFDPDNGSHQLTDVERNLFALCICVWVKAVLRGGHPALILMPLSEEGSSPPSSTTPQRLN